MSFHHLIGKAENRGQDAKGKRVGRLGVDCHRSATRQLEVV
jgi:hypothetical protein